MKFAIGAALAAVTAATAAAAETPDELIYLICHGDRVGEVFVMTQTDDGIGSVSSHPGVEIIHQDDGVTLVDPNGPVYQLTLGDSFTIRDGEAHPMSCHDKTKAFEAGAALMAERMNDLEVERARRDLAEAGRRAEKAEAQAEAAEAEAAAAKAETAAVEADLAELLNETEEMRAMHAKLEKIRFHSAFMADRLPRESTLGAWLRTGEVELD